MSILSVMSGIVHHYYAQPDHTVSEKILTIKFSSTYVIGSTLCANALSNSKCKTSDLKTSFLYNDMNL